MTQLNKQTQFSNLPGPGPGRPKGSRNKVTIILKEAILEAGKNAGGQLAELGHHSALLKDKLKDKASLLMFFLIFSYIYQPYIVPLGVHQTPMHHCWQPFADAPETR